MKQHPFPATMSRNRFKSILRFLRFDDTWARKARIAARKAAQGGPSKQFSYAMPPPEDNFGHIREIAHKIISTFYHLLEPGRNLVVDEQIVKFKGRCGFRVYMKSKEGGSREIEQGKRVVLDLAEVYAGTGRNITADNFFSSLKLCLELREKNLTYLQCYLLG
ncbi:unnamed protein product [Allacma fusca]|uniref:PiggyBac transposable element-derived protein domain-containing protein n=1 Tax=Allacma fusca TaxID=39272 RepID=A0A8J2L228_9HEXA|nr:unnamed protein product [Allacma fusca]